MKCQICKVRDANIVFTQIVNNEKMVLHICSECASSKGLTVDINIGKKPGPESLLHAIKGEQAKQGVPADRKQEEHVPDLTCDKCGLTYAEFKRSGLFGCEYCHLAFEPHVSSLLKQIHGTLGHEGRKPTSEISREVQARQRLKKLKTELARSVEVEDYERAAIIRDQIDEIEKDRQES